MSNFLNNLKEEELLGFRIALGLLFVFIISSVFSLERSYWAVVTVLTLNITINFSDILARSWHGIIASIVGLIFGTLIEHYFLAQSSDLIKNIFLIVATVITLYFMFIDHTLEVFFLSFYVVFLLSFFDQWSLCLLELRLLEIAIGTAISLFVGYILITTNQKYLLRKKLKKLYGETTKLLQTQNIKYEYRFLSIQQLHQNKQNILQDIKYSKYDLKYKEFYLNVKEFLILVDDLTYNYDRFHDMYTLMKENKNTFLDVIHDNIEQILSEDSEKKELKQLKPSTAQEEILYAYYVKFIDNVELTNLKYSHL